jgi:hypothetical protein
MLRHPVFAAAVAAPLLLGLAGCAGNSGPPAATPVTMRLVDIQSGTVQVPLHQVLRIDTGLGDWRYSALIADQRIVTVVQHRNEGDGTFSPELVPLHVGRTQVALVNSIPGQAVVGFTVVVTPHP